VIFENRSKIARNFANISFTYFIARLEMEIDAHEMFQALNSYYLYLMVYILSHIDDNTRNNV